MADEAPVRAGPLTLDALAAPLAAIVGADAVYADERRLAYRVDGLTPAFAVAPGSAEEVAAVLALAAESAVAVIPWGAGSAMALGYPPRAGDIALDLRRLNRVLQYEPADLTLSVEAGISFEGLAATLAGYDQRLALDCAQPGVATLGGLVAANLAGPRRLRYGTVRDQLIGICAAYPDGTLGRAGGMVVKNVSGYDMMKLHVGALATLGVLVELNFKVAPRPASEGTVLAVFSAPEAALRAGHELLATQLVPSAVVVLDAAVAAGVGVYGGGGVLAVSFEGIENTVTRELQDVRDRAPAWGARTAQALDAGQAAELWERLLAFQALETDPVNSALIKLSVAPTDLETVLADVVDLCGQVELRCLQVADVGSGIVFVRVGQSEEQPEAVFAWALWALQTELVRRWGQSVVLSCPSVAKENLPLWGREPAGLAVMRALKQQFDPGGTLNPGRFVGRL